MMRDVRDERKEDKPPFSRLFVVCSKQHRQEDLRPEFETYGEIEEFSMPKDRNTGESRGIAYVKYSKTTSAAAAIDALHLKTLEKDNKPIKVMVASHRHEEKTTNEEKYKRLFIRVPKDLTASDIKEHFSKYGNVANVRLQKDRESNENKGFAYVNYNTFLEAATAFEQCDRKYKPIFAIPKDELKRTRNSFENSDRFPSSDSVFSRDFRDYGFHNNFHSHGEFKREIMPFIKTPPKDFDTINVLCSPCVPQKSIERLFNVIPGMNQFKYTVDKFNGISQAIIKYDSKVAAAHAMESLNNYEFPSGEKISIQPDKNPLSQVASNLSNIVNSFKNSLETNSDLMQLADAIAQASSLIKAATSGTDAQVGSHNDSFCSVRLPPVKPLASADSKVAQRCFLVFKPYPPPVGALRDAFCRFGDLIDVAVFPNKTFGFAKFASVKAAEDAMGTLHGATLHGIQLKVMEAEEKPLSKDDKMKVDEDNDKQGDSTDYDMKSKRIKRDEI